MRDKLKHLPTFFLCDGFKLIMEGNWVLTKENMKQENNTEILFPLVLIIFMLGPPFLETF